MRYLTFTFLLAMFSSAVFASQDKVSVVLRIQSQDNGNIDETTLYFDNGIQPVYVLQEDAQKVFSNVPGVPALFSLTADSINCSINGFNTPDVTKEIAIGYEVDVDGLYDISLPFLDNMDPTAIVRLEDRLLGVFTDMRQSKYTAQLNAADPATGRFFVHVSSPIVAQTINAGCVNNGGAINIEQDNSVAWTSVTLLDAFNNQVAVLNDASGQFNFDNLASGNYYIVYAYGNYTTTQTFHIQGNYVVISNITASKVHASVGEVIDFTANVTNGQVFNWNFGDGTTITGVMNPSISYYEAGDYVVTFSAMNDHGCSDNAQLSISVEGPTGIKEEVDNNAAIYAAGSQITVKLNTEVKNAQLQVYNLIGQSVHTSPITEQTSTVALDTQPSGVYIVSVKNNGAFSTKRVFVGR